MSSSLVALFDEVARRVQRALVPALAGERLVQQRQRPQRLAGVELRGDAGVDGVRVEEPDRVEAAVGPLHRRQERAHLAHQLVVARIARRRAALGERDHREPARPQLGAAAVRRGQRGPAVAPFQPLRHPLDARVGGGERPRVAQAARGLVERQRHAGVAHLVVVGGDAVRLDVVAVEVAAAGPRGALQPARRRGRRLPHVRHARVAAALGGRDQHARRAEHDEPEAGDHKHRAQGDHRAPRCPGAAARATPGASAAALGWGAATAHTRRFTGIGGDR